MSPVDAKALDVAAARLSELSLDDGYTTLAAETIDAYLNARRPAGDMRMKPGEGVLLDMLGAQSVITQPEGQQAIVIDLAGKLNKRELREERRYLMSVGQAAELVYEIVQATSRRPDMREAFDAELARLADLLRAELEGAPAEPPA